MANIRIIARSSMLGAILLAGACEKSSEPLPETTVNPQAQYFAPIDALGIYVDGFHFYSGDIDDQVEAHHYVTVLDEDLMQALIYDGTGEGAKLIGVEYIISAQLFELLPPEEKLLWHSHVYEVKSGMLIAPGIPADAEHELMSKLVATYGKTWHTWHTHRNSEVPTGIPALMMAFTASGQVDKQLLENRDERLDVDTAQVAVRRADIEAPEVDPLADAWEEGKVVTLERSDQED